MNILAILIPALVLYFLAQRFYAPLLGRVFGEDDTRMTPAVRVNDGVDYVPTGRHVLFAHHFSAIAAAGPILGPTLALLYGYGPAFLWIIFGAILIGAMHDYACLFVSMREGGKSLADIARRVVGPSAFLIFALFIIFNLAVVNAVFIHLTAVSLTSLQAPADLGLEETQTIFRTVEENGVRKAVVGGIASSSAIALTLVAPILGYIVIKRGMRNRYAYPLATIVCIGSVMVGFVLPVAIPPLNFGAFSIDPASAWVVLIALYVLFAAAVPVWLILQPREFVSVQFLYMGIALLVVALIGAGLQGVPLNAPSANVEVGEHNLGALWPTLFVTIACGAVSGFHGLVASGTTSKQIMRESDARRVGYAAMLGESALALCVTLTIGAGMLYSDYLQHIVRPENAGPGWRENPILAFSVGVAGICELGLGIPQWLGVVFGLLMVEGFVLDTLDVAIRLNRYLLEEIWSMLFRRVPRILKNYWTNSGIAVALMLAFAFGNTAKLLWPIFGTGNQLLASLSLMTIALWLYRSGRRVRYVLVPAMLVFATTIGALTYLFFARYLPNEKYLLAGMAVVFFLLAVGYAALTLRAAWQVRRSRFLTAGHN